MASMTNAKSVREPATRKTFIIEEVGSDFIEFGSMEFILGESKILLRRGATHCAPCRGSRSKHRTRRCSSKNSSETGGRDCFQMTGRPDGNAGIPCFGTDCTGGSVSGSYPDTAHRCGAARVA